MDMLAHSLTDPAHLTESQMIDPGDKDQRTAVIAINKMKFWEI